jgi:hypothetical protein
MVTLRRAIEIVAARVPDSFAEKQEMRLHLPGLFIEYGMAAFCSWLNINPSDLRDPLVLKLAGVTRTISRGTEKGKRNISQEDCEHERLSEPYSYDHGLSHFI